MLQSTGEAREAAAPGSRPFWLTVFGTLLLLLPAIANGYPLLFFDTPAYLTAGEGILSRVGIVEKVGSTPSPEQAAAPQPAAAAPDGKQDTPGFSDARSIYYGLLADLGRRIGGLYVTALFQALWVAAAIVLAMRQTGPRGTKAKLGMIAAVALLGGAAFGVSVILPDMAGGVLLLGMALIAAFPDRLSRGEWAFWLISIVAAISFHKAFFLVAIALFVASGLVPGRPLWRGKAGLLMGGALAVSAVLTFATEPVVERVTGVATPHVPFLLGRTIEDGTAVALLRKECPHARWATCAMLPGMPMTAGEFLWDGTTRNGVHVDGWMARPVAERSQISAESRELVKRTVLNDPWAQFRAAVWNAFDQFVSSGVTRYDQSAQMAKVVGAQLPQETRHMQAAAFYQRPAYLAAASAVMIVFCLGSALLLVAAIFAGRRSKRWPPLIAFGAVVLMGAVLNAAIGGALVVVVDRYQGRLAWTMLFAAIAIGCACTAERRHRPARPAPGNEAAAA
jgi:hypothetical protein